MNVAMNGKVRLETENIPDAGVVITKIKERIKYEARSKYYSSDS